MKAQKFVFTGANQFGLTTEPLCKNVQKGNYIIILRESLL